MTTGLAGPCKGEGFEVPDDLSKLMLNVEYFLCGLMGYLIFKGNCLADIKMRLELPVKC